MTFDDKTESAQPVVLQRLGEFVELATGSLVELSRIQGEIDHHIEAGLLRWRPSLIGLALTLFLGPDADSARRTKAARTGEELHDVFRFLKRIGGNVR